MKNRSTFPSRAGIDRCFSSFLVCFALPSTYPLCRRAGLPNISIKNRSASSHSGKKLICFAASCDALNILHEMEKQNCHLNASDGGVRGEDAVPIICDETSRDCPAEVHFVPGLIFRGPGRKEGNKYNIWRQ